MLWPVPCPESPDVGQTNTKVFHWQLQKLLQLIIRFLFIDILLIWPVIKPIKCYFLCPFSMLSMEEAMLVTSLPCKNLCFSHMEPPTLPKLWKWYESYRMTSRVFMFILIGFWDISPPEEFDKEKVWPRRHQCWWWRWFCTKHFSQFRCSRSYCWSYQGCWIYWKDWLVHFQYHQAVDDIIWLI